MKSRRAKINAAFRQQRGNAEDRGIDFYFTRDEWVDWWLHHLGPDWLKKRGCKKDQYVMARWYDDGPYAPHNVKCITARQNHLERNKRLWMSRKKTKTRCNTNIVWYEAKIE